MKKRILSLQFRHETNAFCPRQADETAFRNNRFLTGEAVIADQMGLGTETGALLEVFRGRDDVQIVPTVALYASPCGPVTGDIYDFVAETLVRTIREQGPFDAVFADVHGAMVADDHPDGEGDLFAMIRRELGWDIPLFAPLDLHANVTGQMARCANVLLPYNTYPHIDIFETGRAVAELLDKTLAGQVQPKLGYRRVAFQLPLFPSADANIRPLYELAAEMEKRPGVLYARFTHGFYPADIDEVGMAALVITDGDEALADRLAAELAEAMETQIPKLRQTYMPLDEALDRALIPGSGPVVIADASDNPGAGGLGDTTHILRRILERGITGAAVATILDPAAAELCEKAGVGETVELQLGGWSDPVYSGGSLNVVAKVLQITDGCYINQGPVQHGVTSNHGKTALVEIAGNRVLISSIPRQVFDPEIFRKHAIAPETENLLVVKSTIHYRAAFGQFARELIPVVVPGYAAPTPEGYIYKNWKGYVC